MNRLPHTCAALRRARTAALYLASEADVDGRHGIARALRRKVHDPRPGDWIIVHHARRVEARIWAYGIVAIGERRVSSGKPSSADAERMALAAARIVAASPA